MSSALSPRHAVYAGSFDPVTLGHVDIAHRGARIFDQLTVAIGINPEKAPLFSPEERVSLLREVFRDVSNISVACFEGLTVDFVQQHCEAAVMLRGLRTVSDLESEFSMALANSTLAPQVETVFLMAGEKFSHISSTLIRQVAALGKENSLTKLRQFVPEAVIEPLLAKCKDRRSATD